MPHADYERVIGKCAVLRARNKRLRKALHRTRALVEDILSGRGSAVADEILAQADAALQEDADE